MIKVYICPNCGWIRMVSRRKEVQCHRCGIEQMTQTGLTVAKYSAMSEKERSDYSQAWLFIHNRRGRIHERQGNAE